MRTQDAGIEMVLRAVGAPLDEKSLLDAKGLGTIYSYTVARRPAGPSFKDVVPYVVALIVLDEGPRMMTRMQCDSPEAIRIGQRVQVNFERVTPEFTLPHFRSITP